MLSMNEVYARRGLFYWTNALAEINVPGDGNNLLMHTPDELPAGPRNLYELCQDGDVHRYLVTMDGRTGIMLQLLYSTEYIGQLLGLKEDAEVGPLHMRGAYLYLSAMATCLEKQPCMEGCSVMVGEMTDPDGHEIAVFVPDSICRERVRLETIAESFWFFVQSEDREPAVDIAIEIYSRTKKGEAT